VRGGEGVMRRFVNPYGDGSFFGSDQIFGNTNNHKIFFFQARKKIEGRREREKESFESERLTGEEGKTIV
jgi:hypothetical protein